MEFIEINEQYRINKVVPIEKVFSKNTELYESVKSIRWTGNIKPKLSGVTATLTEKLRYEEVQFLAVELTDKDSLYTVARCIYRAIKYPCIIEFKFGDAVSIGTARYDKGIRDIDINTNIIIFFSHWLRKSYTSDEAKKMVGAINNIINSKDSIDNIIIRVSNEIAYYPIGGISSTHVDRILYDLVGKDQREIKRIIVKNGIPFKVFSKNLRYQSNKNIKNYKLSYDSEEFWYCLMQCKKTRESIEKRKYRNINELIIAVDMKYWEHDQEW